VPENVALCSHKKEQVRCSVLQYLLQFIFSVLQCVAMCWSIDQKMWRCAHIRIGALQCVLQFYCSVLQHWSENVALC